MNWLHASTAALNASAKAHRKWAVATDSWIDVFDVAAKQGLFLGFRPLDKLGAAVISESGAGTGILVNSKHPLSRQRYSVAHELGHFFFRHPSIVDMADIFESGAAARTDEEKLAESFASWFLMPPKLLDAYVGRRGIERIHTAEEAYQLSLFLGTSYESTISHLRYTERATSERAATWLREPPQKIKRRLAGKFELESWRNDVHVLEEVDDATSRLVRSRDLVVVQLHEIPSSGYRWQMDHSDAFGVLSDDYDSDYVPGGDLAKPTGALRMRKFILSANDVEQRVNLPLVFKQVRTWRRQAPSRHFEARVTIESVERVGFPPRYLAEIAA